MPDRIALKTKISTAIPNTNHESPSMRPGFFILGLVLAPLLAASAAELPPGATLLDPDLLWDLEPEPNNLNDIQDPVFVLSPDDQSIAYISKGALWKCNVTAGPSIKLVDLPDTKTAILATPEHRDFWNSVLEVRNSTVRKTYQGRIPRGVGVHSLAWTANQDGLVYTLAKGSGERPWTAEYFVRHVLNERAVQPVCKFQRNTYDEPKHFTAFNLSRDMRHVVASNGYRPQIIVARTGRPRATCFDTIVPSTSSDRYLGIEIDTRHLVIADNDFNILERFDVIFDQKRNVDLLWSPDEKYALCREHRERPSSDWDGFRFDLRTGGKRALEPANKKELCMFTGHGGEIVRIGAFPTVFGATYIAIVPQDDKPQWDVVRWPNVQQLDDPQANGRYPDVIVGRDARLFAMAFPREGRTPGYRYSLIDRDGNRWSCGPDDQTRRLSPYRVVAIANRGKTLVACNDTQLFSIPVETIKHAQPSD